MASSAAAAQPSAKPLQRSVGEVAAIDGEAHKLTVKADAGGEISVTLGEKTLFLRVPPGEKDLAKATRIALTDIAVGDRVVARGELSEDQKTMAASSIIMMSKAELAKKWERDREEWQKRGTAGTVAAIDPAAKTITVTLPGLAAAKTIAVEVGDQTECRRYAPDSIRFNEAKPSSLAEIKTGDHVRVLGDKNEDGTRWKAEQLISGAFRTISGTVLAIDPAAGEIRITDLSTKKPLAVKVNAETGLRRMPPMLAMFLGRRLNAPAAQGGARQGGGRGASDMQQMMDGMPSFPLAELKKGDALIISSTAGSDPARVTAITVVAGVEPVLTAAPESARQLSSMWNLGDIPLPQ
jgi:Cu/Ag efflux protein CusF